MSIFEEQHETISRVEHLFTVFKSSKASIRPHFFLTGPTGTGKTHMILKAAEAQKMNSFTINAAQLTAEGLSGNSLSKALRPLREHWDHPSIIFVDEFDKLFMRNGEKQGEHQTAVQDEFLGILEAEFAAVFTDYGKYEPVRVSNVLFVFAGAFNGQEITTHKQLREAGMRPEFIGRVPLIFSSKEISLDSILLAVEQTDVYRAYRTLFPKDKRGVNRDLMEIRKRITDAYEDNEIGLRIINFIIHQYFMES